MRPGDFRNLAQAELVVLAGDRLDIDDVAGLEHLRHLGRHAALDRTARGLRPLHALDRHDAGFALLGECAVRLAGGLETDARGLVAAFEHHRQPPRRHVGERLDLGELCAPVAGQVDLAGGAAIAVRFVELDEPVGQRLARQHLHLGVERGAHRQPALVELLLAVVLVDVAAHLFGEILRREDVRAGRPRRDVERRQLWPSRLPLRSCSDPRPCGR